MFTITKNPMFNSLEITFAEKPSEKIRNVLKANKFRWHSVKSVWYGYADEDTIRKAVEQAEDKEPETEKPANGVQVGDLFYCSWGYDQTNVDFVQVIALCGKSSVRVRPVEPAVAEETDRSFMSCERKYINSRLLLPAVKSVICEDNSLHRLNKYDNRVYFKSGSHYFYPYKGESLYESWYA